MLLHDTKVFVKHCAKGHIVPFEVTTVLVHRGRSQGVQEGSNLISVICHRDCSSKWVACRLKSYWKWMETIVFIAIIGSRLFSEGEDQNISAMAWLIVAGNTYATTFFSVHDRNRERSRDRKASGSKVKISSVMQLRSSNVNNDRSRKATQLETAVYD